MQTLLRFGWMVNLQMFMLEPAHCLQYLGLILVDTTESSSPILDESSRSDGSTYNKNMTHFTPTDAIDGPFLLPLSLQCTPRPFCFLNTSNYFERPHPLCYTLIHLACAHTNYFQMFTVMYITCPNQHSWNERLGQCNGNEVAAASSEGM